MEKYFKLVAVLLILMVVALGGAGYKIYEKNNLLLEQSKQIKELKKNLEILKGKEILDAVVKEQQLKLDFFNKEKEMLPATLNVGYSFAKNVISGNVDQLEPMLDSTLVVVKEKDQLFLIKNGDLSNKFLLKDDTEDKVLVDMHVNAYSKIDDNIYFVQVLQYFTTKDGKEITPPTFMNLRLTEKDGKFKVIDVEYDV